MSENVLQSDDASDGNGEGDRAAVTISNVTKQFGELTAVDNVSFDIRDGEFFTILGPSGSGKSTLLRILAGLETMTAGDLYIKERDMQRVPPEKRPTNMVFQHLALFPHKNVYENLAFGLKMQGTDKSTRRERADEMLELLGLAGTGEKAIDELSGGEQQRIALGRSLLANPEILLLDEPLSSLDRKLKEEMQIELRRIHDELDSTFLYVTHDQDVALTASDRVALINDGKLAQVGTPQELYEEPATEFVAQFIGDTNLLVGEVKSAADDTLTVETDAGITFDVAGEVAAGETVRVSLRPEQVNIGSHATGDDNTFEGVLEERIYRGDRTRFEVSVGDTRLLIQRTAERADESFEIGQTVSVGWDAADGYLVEEA